MCLESGTSRLVSIINNCQKIETRYVQSESKSIHADDAIVQFHDCYLNILFPVSLIT